MRQSFIEQRANHIAHAASFMEMVHVARSIGVNARYQRHGAGQLRQIVPVEPDACRACHCRYVDRMIGRPARRQQADGRVHDGLFIHHSRQRTEVFARFPDCGEAMGSCAAQLLP